MHTTTTDVLVIGSGFGAAAPAMRLAEAGYAVTILEKGPKIDPRRDFRQTQDPRYLLKYLKGVSGENLGLTFAEGLGGGSGFYEVVTLRAPSIAFEQADASGRRLWPAGLDRAAFDPFYEMAERMLKVSQIHPDRVPKNGQVFSLMMQRLGYSCERAPYGVRGCFACGFCTTGCIYGAKQSLLLNYLPRAVEAGATVHTDTQALTIRPVRERWAADDRAIGLPVRYEVVARHAGSGRRTRYRTRVLVLAGGTVGTARLLLASREFLPQLSDRVGHGIGFNGGVKVAGLLGPDLPDVDMFAGRSHAGMISYEFLASRGITIAAGKPLPLQVVASARLRRDGDERTPLTWGAANVDLMQQFRHRLMVLAAFGLTPPTARLVPTASGDVTVRLELTDELRRYYRETRALLHSIITRTGGTVVHADFVDQEGSPYEDLHFSTAHQVGSCRMAESAVDGVCDADGQVFGYPALYVTDGAAIPTSLAVNTGLTILANAERVSHHMLQHLAAARDARTAA